MGAAAFRHRLTWLVLIAGLIILAGETTAPATPLRDCMQSGNAQLAVAACTTIIEKGSRNRSEMANALLFRGNAYLSLNSLDLAIADYARVLELRPNDVNAFHATGQAYNAKGDYDRAIANYDKAIALAPNAIYSFTGRSFAYNSKGDYDRSIADCEKAIQLKRDLPDSYFACGESYLAKGDKAKALAYYRTALALFPADAKAEVEAKIGALEASTKPPQQQANSTPQIAPAKNTVPSNMALADRRVALVIGNSAYRSVALLPNPAKDAELVGAALRSAGIDDVTIMHDLDREGMIAALKTFANKADAADWAVIYYAGHGIEVEGTNYLIPVDARLESDRDVPDETVSLQRMLSSIEGAHKLRLVVLDACRNNPFVSQMKVITAHRAIERGLSRVEPTNATLVVYAAKEGTTALDGTGADSPFAVSFAKRVTEPGLEINKTFRFVRQDVLDETGNRQEPFVYGSLPPEDFYFVPGR